MLSSFAADAPEPEMFAAIERDGAAIVRDFLLPRHDRRAPGPTDQARIGLYVGFILSWLRPIENHLITHGEAAPRAAPERARRLLDYSESGWDVVT